MPEIQEKPYPNFHACRIREPIDGAETRYAKNEREHDGKKYDVIYQKTDGEWEDQAYRYPKGTWDVGAARSHCKSHDGILFEPAGKEMEEEQDDITEEVAKGITALTERKGVDVDARTVTAVANAPTMDRDGEVIDPKAWDLKNYQKNPVLMLSHDYRALPVGRVFGIKVDKASGNLVFSAEFAKTAIGDELLYMYSEGFIRGFSVGFIPRKAVTGDDINRDKYPDMAIRRVYTKVELLEISCVAIPAHPDALVEALESGAIKTKTVVDAFTEALVEANIDVSTMDHSEAVIPEVVPEVTSEDNAGMKIKGTVEETFGPIGIGIQIDGQGLPPVAKIPAGYGIIDTEYQVDDGYAPTVMDIEAAIMAAEQKNIAAMKECVKEIVSDEVARRFGKATRES